MHMYVPIVKFILFVFKKATEETVRRMKFGNRSMKNMLQIKKNKYICILLQKKIINVYVSFAF